MSQENSGQPAPPIPVIDEEWMKHLNPLILKLNQSGHSCMVLSLTPSEIPIGGEFDGGRVLLAHVTFGPSKDSE